MVHLLSKLQDSAVDSASQLSTTHRVSLHAITAGILHLLCHISTVPALTEHVLEVVQRRSETAPLLLPDQFFTAERADGAEGRGDIPTRVGEDLLFHLRERGLVRQSPEPTMDPTSKRSQLMRESSTTSNDFLPHASLSLDYGSDSPLGVEQINFSSFKKESAFDESPTTDMRERLGSSLTYEQQVGISSKQETGLGGIAHLVHTTSPPHHLPLLEDPVDLRATSSSAYDIELPALNSGL
jgi:hypothetical protein